MSPSALQLAHFDPVGMVVLYDQTLAADAASFDVQNIPAGSSPWTWGQGDVMSWNVEYGM